MQKSVFKVFFSKEKETKWLNSLGQDGYLLSSINDSRYKFDKFQDKSFCYSIEYIDCSPESDTAKEYYESRSDEGVMPLVASGNWVYFASSCGEISNTEQICKKNSKFYFWRIFYLLFFAISGAVVCGYQMFASGYLSRIGHGGNGQITEMLSTSDSGGVFDGLLNVLKSVVNFFYGMLNSYFRIWTNIFGESDAVSVISVVAPITILLLIITAFNIDEYLRYRKSSRMLREIAEVDKDAEQKIQY